ncbi:MAG: putative N6-adenine-specific DNA methylase [Limisphaerales bacterium]|jgi:putative N6-adenine-specific DNA methylase
MSNNELHYLSAKTFRGLEEILAEELKELGASDIEIKRRAVTFRGDNELMYKACLHLRTALRVHMILFHFEAEDAEDLYDGIAEYDWSYWINPEQTIAVDSVVHSRYFTHSRFAALKAKDAIVDRVRTKYKKRPDIDVENPDYRIQLRIDENFVELSLDASGDSLHKRGYRSAKVTAPLNEVLAAGMLNLAGYKGERDFADPFCGSGTLVLEAAMLAANKAPGLIRIKNGKFGFQKWKDFDLDTWERVVENAKAAEMIPEVNLIASDMEPKAIRASKENALMAGVLDYIQFVKGNALESTAPSEKGLLVTNPPYGERLESEFLDILYGDFGTRLKHFWPGWDAWIISSNREALKSVGLKTARRLELFNGAISCKFHHYELYKGSKKMKSGEKEINENKD